jgi:hypothetical protein
MANQDRISRHDRQRGPSYFKIFIIIIMTLLLVGIISIRFKTPFEKKTPSVPVVDIKPRINLSALSDSLIIACCQSFGLGDSIIRISGHNFQQPWPVELPFINFAQRLSKMAMGKGIFCDCLESQKDKWLKCILKQDKSTESQVLVEGNKSTRLAGREIAILFDNIYSIKSNKLKWLIKTGTPFGYFAAPDIYPTGEIKTLFAKAEIPAILKLPIQKSDWEKLELQTQSNKRGNARASFPAIIEIIFDRHPSIIAICFDTIGVADQGIVKSILETAKQRKIAYLVDRQIPSEFDNLALSAGLRLISLNIKPELRSNSLADLKLNLFQQLLSGEEHMQLIVGPDATQIGPDDILDLRILCEHLGIKLRPCMKLATRVETL